MAACGRDAEQPEAEAADAGRDELDGQDGAVHGIPAARCGPDGAVRRPPDAAERLLRDDRGPAAARVHAGIGRDAGGAAGQRAIATGRVQGRSRGAARRPLSLGAGGRRARAVGPPRSRIDDGVRRPGRPRLPTRRAVPSDDPSAITYLKEPQWTNGFGTALARETRGAAIDSRARDHRAADGWGGDRVGPGRRTIHRGGPAVGRRPSAGRPGAGRHSATLRWRGGRSSDARRRRCRGAGVGRGRARRSRACGTSARRARRAGAARRGGAAGADGRRGAAGRGAGAAGAARRDAANRRRRRRRKFVRAAGPHLGPSSRRCSPRSAPRTRKARRCSASCGPTASSCRCTSRRPTPRLREPIAEIALEIPGRAEPRRRGCGSHARRRRHRPGHARPSRAVRRRQPRRPTADRPDGDRRPLYWARVNE